MFLKTLAHLCLSYSCRSHIEWLHISALFIDFSFRFYTRSFYSGYLLGTTVLIILSIYMGPVARQVDDHQGIQSILCCALHHYLIQVIPTSSEEGIRHCQLSALQRLCARPLLSF